MECTASCVLLSPGPLSEYGIRDGDMLLLQRVQGERGQPMAGRQLSSSVPSQSSSGGYRHMSLSSLLLEMESFDFCL